MARRCWVFGVGLGVGWLLGGCGESQDVPSRQERTLGGVSEGAPLGRDVADPGILADASTYQPAKVAASPAATAGPRRPPGAAAKRGESAGDADTQIKAAVRDLVNALKDGEVELALRSFNPEQVRLLLDRVDVLLDTYEKVDLLRRHLEKQLAPDESKVEQLLGPLRGGESELKWDVLDADHVSISPNLALPLFGPKATPTLQLARQGGEWRYQLDAPLTAEDVNTIVAFHEQLQKALDAAVEWVATSPTVDEDQLRVLLAKALQGGPAEPGAEPAAAGPKAKPGAEKDTGEKKEEQKPAPRGKGGRLRPPGG